MIQNQTNSEQKDNSSLSTDEILGVLKKADKGFTRETNISGKISKIFRKTDIVNIAEKNNALQTLKTPKKKIDENINIENKPSEAIEKEPEKKNKVEVKPKPLKKYTEQEANTKARELAEKYYYYGYNLGVKNIKKELQKGENNLAITLKNTIDNLFFVSQDFTEKLSGEINKTILKLCQEVIGYHISAEPGKFDQKISKLANSISNSTNKIKVFLNPEDLKIITKFIKNNNPQTRIDFLEEKNLDRGDLKIKSGEIEIDEIFSKKVIFNSDFDKSFLLNDKKD